MSNVIERPETALPAGPLPGRPGVWVVAILAVIIGVILTVALPRMLSVDSPTIDCTIGSADYSDQCADEPPAEEDLVNLGDAK